MQVEPLIDLETERLLASPPPAPSTRLPSLDSPAARSRSNTIFSDDTFTDAHAGSEASGHVFEVGSASSSRPASPSAHNTTAAYPDLLASFDDVGPASQHDDGVSLSSFTIRSDDSDLPSVRSSPRGRLPHLQEPGSPHLHPSNVSSGRVSPVSSMVSDGELLDYSGSETGTWVELSDEEDEVVPARARPFQAPFLTM
jgi:hypothetical protein